MTEQKLPSDYLEQGWCQDASARNIDGFEVDPMSPDAVCWCHHGAAVAAFGKPIPNNLYSKYYTTLSDVLRARTGELPTIVNDQIYSPDTGQSLAVSDAREAELRAGLR